MPDITKPSPEPSLTYHSDHTFKGNNIGNARESNPYKAFESYTFKIKDTSSGDHELN